MRGRTLQHDANRAPIDALRDVAAVRDEQLEDARPPCTADVESPDRDAPYDSTRRPNAHDDPEAHSQRDGFAAHAPSREQHDGVVIAGLDTAGESRGHPQEPARAGAEDEPTWSYRDP
jgi:hypothetical protein